MTAGRRKTRVVHKLHIVPKRRKGGVRYYVYAWRGGPQIHVQDIERPVIDIVLLDKAAKARSEFSGVSGEFEEIISAYRESPEFTNLKPSTQRDYRLWLDRISERFGDSPIGAFEDRRMRGDIILWRDTWMHQPRTADKAAVMMATLLGWAVDRALLSINIAAQIKKLHHVDKSHLIWERHHMRAFTRAPKHVRHVLMMAGLTGLRLSDLLALEWSQVGRNAIIVEKTQKRNARAVIPLLPETRLLLAKLGKREGKVLKNSRRKGWTANGFGTVFQRLRPNGFDRTIHDLRGTFATRLIRSRLTDSEAALILGWSAKDIATIRARYVSQESVVIDIAERLSA